MYHLPEGTLTAMREQKTAMSQEEFRRHIQQRMFACTGDIWTRYWLGQWFLRCREGTRNEGGTRWEAKGTSRKIWIKWKKRNCLHPRTPDSDSLNWTANDIRTAHSIFMCIKGKHGFLKIEQYSFKGNIINHSQVSKELLGGRIYFQHPLC